jgi:hypothetical protein
LRRFSSKRFLPFPYLVQEVYREAVGGLAGSSDNRFGLFHTKDMEQANLFWNSILSQRSTENSPELLEATKSIVEITLASD